MKSTKHRSLIDVYLMTVWLIMMMTSGNGVDGGDGGDMISLVAFDGLWLYLMMACACS